MGGTTLLLPDGCTYVYVHVSATMSRERMRPIILLVQYSVECQCNYNKYFKRREQNLVSLFADSV